METIGKYEVLAKIGEGGFGVVYRGRDPFLKRLVAIKTLSSDHPELRDRFFREAEVAGRLQHPAITNVYDFGFHGTVPYLVQEYLEGEDLDVLIARRAPLSLLDKVEIFVQLAQGLEYAHQEGVVHRDIKPSNMRLLAGLRVKIMDFGIAKLKGVASQLTRTGMTLGTAAYLPPEQLRGEAVDQRADLFSFGASAYEIVAYRRPFDGTSVHRLFFQVLKEDPPPLEQLVADCPPLLAGLIERCLRKQADERYPSATPVLSELLVVRDELWQRQGGRPGRSGDRLGGREPSGEQQQPAEVGLTTGFVPTLARSAAAPSRGSTAGSTNSPPTPEEAAEKLRLRALSLIAQDALDEARQALAEALELCPGDPELTSSLAAIEGELDRRGDDRRRREVVAQVVGEVEADLAAGDLAAAAERLADAQLELGDDLVELQALRSRVEVERSRRRRDRAATLATAVRQELAGADLHAAAARLEELVDLDPDHRDLPALRVGVAQLAAATVRAATRPGEEGGLEGTVGGLSAHPPDPRTDQTIQTIEEWLSRVGERLSGLSQEALIAIVFGCLVLLLLAGALILL